MLKFREIGTYKNAVNVGYCKATVEMHNGNVVVFSETAKTASMPTTGKETELAIVMSKIDKPEIESPNEFKIEKDEFPRLFTLSSLRGRIIDMDLDQVSTAYASIDVGDTMVADTDGKIKVVDSVEGYTGYFEVTEKTAYNGEGIAVKVVIAPEVSVAK